MRMPQANAPARCGALESIAAERSRGAVRPDDKRVIIW
jgi:hypothetical protein